MRSFASALRAPLRVAMALVLAATFGARVAAMSAAWGCMASGAADHAAHHQHDTGAPEVPAPPCVCVAQVSGVSLAMAPPRVLATVQAPSPPLPATLDDTRPRAADAHLLPFSIGPPAPLA